MKSENQRRQSGVETTSDRNRSKATVTERRRFLGIGATIGAAALAGCTLDEDGLEISFPGGSDDDSAMPAEDDAGSEQTRDDDGTDGGDDDGEGTDTDGSDEEETGGDDGDDDEEGDEEESVATDFRVGDFSLTSLNGDINVYGNINIRGVYDEDEYINPRGHSDWVVWERDESGYLSLDENVPRNVIGADSTVEFPEHVMEELAESEPYVIVRCDFFRRRESLSNQFIGWDSKRVFLEASADAEYEEQELWFTGEGNELRLTFSVTPS